MRLTIPAWSKQGRDSACDTGTLGIQQDWLVVTMEDSIVMYHNLAAAARLLGTPSFGTG